MHLDLLQGVYKDPTTQKPSESLKECWNSKSNTIGLESTSLFGYSDIHSMGSDSCAPARRPRTLVVKIDVEALRGMNLLPMK
jgi:hypothetical protein